MKSDPSLSSLEFQPVAASLDLVAPPNSASNRATRRRNMASANQHASLDATTSWRESLLREQSEQRAAFPIPDRILRLHEVLDIVGFGRTTLLGLVKQNKFAQPIRLTERTRGWRLSSVLAFLESREAESRNDAA